MTVETGSAESSMVNCPKCNQSSRKLIVDVDRVDWLKFLLIGFWAALICPSNRRKGFQCEHCGNIFLPKPVPKKKSDRVIGVLLCAFPILMVVILIVLMRMAVDK